MSSSDLRTSVGPARDRVLERMVGSVKEGVDEGGPDPSELGGCPGRIRQLERPVEVGDDDLGVLADGRLPASR